MQEEGILVVDYGSQLAQTIARRCRELGYYSEILNPEDVTESGLEKALGIISSGGPSSVYEDDSPRPSKSLSSSTLPALDICYAFQLYAHLNDGETKRGDGVGEYGKAVLNLLEDCPVFNDLPEEQVVWMSHGDYVSELPPGMKLIGSTSDCKYAAAWDLKKKRIGVQFHPEVDDTEYSQQIMGNFLELCGKPENPWTYELFVEQAVQQIKEQVGDQKVVHLTSGGKDSTLAALLLQMAGVDVDFVHIDCGLERKYDVPQIERNLRAVGIEPIILDTTEELEVELEGVIGAEEKRHIIGKHYIRVAERYARERYGDNWVIGQGTIYPDHIESQGTKHSAKIKTHHNRVPEVLELIAQGRIVEPNLYLFKEEVEGIAMYLADRLGLEGLRTIFAPQHPFPGPGLGIRCLCSSGKYMDLFNEEGVFGKITNELQARALLTSLTGEIWNIADSIGYNAEVLPVKSVGLQGDGRTYVPAAVVWGEHDWDKLGDLSTTITNQMKGKINRVVYACGPEKINSIELKEGYITRDRLRLLQVADHIVMSALEKSGYMTKMKQCPTISVPVSINGGMGEAIVIRPFVTKDFMTGSFAQLPKWLIDEMTEKLLALGYSAVLYDISNKPPGTTEWE